MKVGIDINIPQSETHGTLELETNIKKEVKKLKEMEDAIGEVLEAQNKLESAIFRCEDVFYGVDYD